MMLLPGATDVKATASAAQQKDGVSVKPSSSQPHSRKQEVSCALEVCVLVCLLVEEEEEGEECVCPEDISCAAAVRTTHRQTYNPLCFTSSITLSQSILWFWF
ncbi:hypothetical protein ILYODFUR_019844 [Ilyodon furcidens]|uniref:Uncharacterized protein n=1 Tax=Ilyodon furcidens TaxID=33524 RepID=A0ABV0UWT8_9TELE